MANDDVKDVFNAFLNNPNKETLVRALLEFRCEGVSCSECPYATPVTLRSEHASHCSIADALHESLSCFFDKVEDGWLGVNKSGRIFIARAKEDLFDQDGQIKDVVNRLTVPQIAAVHQALCAVSARGENE